MEVASVSMISQVERERKTEKENWQIHTVLLAMFWNIEVTIVLSKNSKKKGQRGLANPRKSFGNILGK